MSVARLASRGSLKGGRSSSSGLRVTVFGSTGFMGRYVVSHLGGVGCQLVLPYRGDEVYMRNLRLMGDLGAINFVKSSIRSLEDIESAVAGSDVVVNLLGIRAETRRACEQQRSAGQQVQHPARCPASQSLAAGCGGYRSRSLYQRPHLVRHALPPLAEATAETRRPHTPCVPGAGRSTTAT